MLKNLKELFSPTICLGCSTTAVNWCDECRNSWQVTSLKPVLGVESCTASVLAPSLMQSVSVWKDQSVRSHSRSFALLLAQSLRMQNWWLPDFDLVLIPDKAHSLRKRGFSPLQDLAAALLRLEPGMNVNTSSELIWSRMVREQRGLTTSQRRQNMHSAFTAKGSFSKPVLIIDDVLTSGATLQSAISALQIIGVTDIYAATLVASRSIHKL